MSPTESVKLVKLAARARVTNRIPALLVHPDHLAHLVPTASKVPTVPRDRLELLEFRLDTWRHRQKLVACSAHRDPRVLPAPLALREVLDPKVNLVRKAQMANLAAARPVLPEKLAPLELLARQALQATKVPTSKLAPRAHQVLLDQLDLQARLDRMVTKVPLESPDPQDRPVLQDHQAKPAIVLEKAQLVHPVQLAVLVRMACIAHAVTSLCRTPKVHQKPT